ALEHTLVAGPKTNAAFLHALLMHPVFAEGAMDTGLIGREGARLAAATPNPKAIAYGVTEMLLHAFHDLTVRRNTELSSGEGLSPWNAYDGFQLGGPRSQTLTVLADGEPTKVEVAWGRGPAGPLVNIQDPEGIHPADDAICVLNDMRRT